MSIASLVPFMLVFFLFSWLLSAILGSVVLVLGHRLRQVGPRVERVAASLAIVLPVALGGYLAIVLAGHSLWSHAPPGAAVAAAHCTSHSHHLHVCLQHGGGWITVPAYVGLLATFSLQLVVRLSWRLQTTVRTLGSVRRLSAMATQRLKLTPLSVSIVPSMSRFCFLAPIPQPHIVVSSTAWDALDVDEKQAVIQHELAHHNHGDTWRRNLLDLFAIAGVPVISQRVVTLWRDATERLCDLTAARAAGEGFSLARALLKLAPTTEFSSVPAFADSGGIERRIEALLAPPLDDATTAGELRFGLLSASVTVSALATVLADPLHHAIETLLG